MQAVAPLVKLAPVTFNRTVRGLPRANQIPRLKLHLAAVQQGNTKITSITFLSTFSAELQGVRVGSWMAGLGSLSELVAIDPAAVTSNIHPVEMAKMINPMMGVMKDGWGLWSVDPIGAAEVRLKVTSKKKITFEEVSVALIFDIVAEASWWCRVRTGRLQRRAERERQREREGRLVRRDPLSPRV